MMAPEKAPKRYFEFFPHPNPDNEGVQRFALYQTWFDAKEQGGKGYELIADGLTAAEVQEQIK